MKITALLVLKSNQDGSDSIILANASDVSHYGYFQRSTVKEFIVFVGRTVAKRTPPSQRQSVQHEEYKVHSYNRNGLCAVGFMDDHYPVRSAFSLLNQVLLKLFFCLISLWWNVAQRNFHMIYSVLILPLISVSSFTCWEDIHSDWLLILLISLYISSNFLTHYSMVFFMCE